MTNEIVPTSIFTQVLEDGMSQLFGGFSEITEDPVNASSG